jgi:predicted DNA-binding protein (MmcQ/YjbR family)
MWERYPRFAVLRHRGSRKWYGSVMNVSRDKLGLPVADAMDETAAGAAIGSAEVDVLNVKCDPGIVYLSKDTPGILPAYHMNKQHWVSVLLDGTVPDERVFQLLDDSWRLTH